MKRNNEQGFTLIEMVTVMGALVILAAFSLFVNLQGYRSDAFRAERDRLITILQTARADALNNVHEQAHGVAINPSDHPHSYVEFEGLNYAASDPASQIVIDMAYPATFSADSPKEIIFYQLNGDAYDNQGVPYDGNITIQDTQRNFSFIILLNHEGRISW